jgi:hypothetical protein
MTRALIIIAFTLFTLTTAPVSAAHEELTPQVAVTVFAAPDGFQMDWFTLGAAEVSEEFCPQVRCVNATLARIGETYSYSVEWRVIA